MTQRGTIVGFRIAHPRIEALPGPDSGICPPGSDCAKQAILTVQAYWRMGRRRDFALNRGQFVEKTGRNE